MDSTDIKYINNPNKTNKVLIFIFIGIVLLTVSLGAYYLYLKKAGSPSPTPTPPFVETNTLDNGIVGQSYKSLLKAEIPGISEQLDIKAMGLPPDLKLTTCSVGQGSIDNSNEKSTPTECYIEGTPNMSGTFKVRIYLTNQDQSINSYKDILLTIQN